ncbi:tigger transposable element-derived protein 4-like [Pecten maximus]|uniref:tigger transposable element-derived protein 4-like n=1 Tax=Pecten maximus TaxID=6579 RepID=UPI001458F1D1|nr:tigger transposable element-derived protein 4-like [Pecten maximus]
MRTANFDDIEAVLLKWFTYARDHNLPISGPMLKSKASDLAEKMGEQNFASSTGWVDRFKERHGICFKKICGEAKSVDTSSDAMTKWADDLRTILSEYQPNNIFNADETGIFYRLLPDRTLDFKGTDCHGGKRSKERLTTLVCANMTGTEKLPLFIIGKSIKPRCFKNVSSLPTEYTANKKAWMTSDIFTDWIRKSDRKFARHRRIVMVIDNCPAHPVIKDLRAIKLIFLPPNTTSNTQPMDQGVIKNLKVHYRKRLLLRHVKAINRSQVPEISVLDAMKLLSLAWGCVTETTIRNYFHHAGFKTDADPTPIDSDDEDDIPLAHLANLPVPFDRYVSVDTDLHTSATMTNDDIVDEILQRKNDNTDDYADAETADNDVSVPPEPTTDMTTDACALLIRALETHPNKSTDILTLLRISDFFLREDLVRQSNARTQTKISDYFGDFVCERDCDD